MRGAGSINREQTVTGKRKGRLEAFMYKRSASHIARDVSYKITSPNLEQCLSERVRVLRSRGETEENRNITRPQ